MNEYQQRQIRNRYITNGLQYVLDNYRKIAGNQVKVDMVREFVKDNFQEWDLIIANEDILGSKDEAYFNNENDYGTILPTSNFNDQIQRMNKIGFK